MKILLTNDDGYNSEGMKYFINYLNKNNFDYKISVPAKEMSAQSSALSPNKHLKISEVEQGIIVDGTPADCVIIGGEYLYGYNNEKPDIVFSGINMGANIGSAIIYSGTVGAAISASLGGIKAVAFSTDFIFNSENASDDFNTYFSKAIDIAIKYPQIENTILNINIPTDNIRGIRVAPMAIFSYDTILSSADETGLLLKYSGKQNYNKNNNKDSDTEHFLNGYMTITPIQYDYTNYTVIDELRRKYETF